MQRNSSDTRRWRNGAQRTGPGQGGSAVVSEAETLAPPVLVARLGRGWRRRFAGRRQQLQQSSVTGAACWAPA